VDAELCAAPASAEKSGELSQGCSSAFFCEGGPVFAFLEGDDPLRRSELLLFFLAALASGSSPERARFKAS
jgi:hypothetical protein